MAAGAAPEVSRLTAEMLDAIAMDSGGPFVGLCDDDEDELEMN